MLDAAVKTQIWSDYRSRLQPRCKISKLSENDGFLLSVLRCPRLRLFRLWFWKLRSSARALVPDNRPSSMQSRGALECEGRGPGCLVRKRMGMEKVTVSKCSALCDCNRLDIRLTDLASGFDDVQFSVQMFWEAGVGLGGSRGRCGGCAFDDQVKGYLTSKRSLPAAKSR